MFNLRRALILCMSVLVAFVYGMLAHRNQIFPYELLRSLALSFGIVEEVHPGADSSGKLDVQSPSRALAQLSALGYIDSSPTAVPEERGVVVNDSSRVFPGYNFYNSWKRPRAWLMDMEGNVLHEWSNLDFSDSWHHAELLPNGDILVSVKDTAIVKLDKSSSVVWSYETRAHHVFWIEGNGDIWLPTRESRFDPEIHPTTKVTDDKILVLSPDGAKKKEISILDMVKRSRYAYLLPRIAQSDFPGVKELDILHTNYVQVFEGDTGVALTARGNIVISMKHLNAIAIINGETLEIEWLWGPGNLTSQHYSTLLENGNILLFDNGSEATRVLEIEPLTMQVKWSYEAGKEFFSLWGGVNQRLGNGNTLITETTRGRSLEVSPDGEVVWEFLNPEVDSKGRRTNIWSMKRFAPSELDTFWD